MKSTQATARRSKVRSFAADNGQNEYFLFTEAPGGVVFADGLQQIEEQYNRALSELGLDEDTVVYRRFFISDASNQMETLRQSRLFAGPGCDVKAAVSVVQQRPLAPCKVAMFAYHVDSAEGNEKITQSNQCLLLRRSGISQLWFTNLAETNDAKDARQQTEELFDQLIRRLDEYGATLEANTVRTWVYVRDVDRNYMGMVDRRRELFAGHGLTAKTHFIASTGIEGAVANHNTLVSMDALSLIGLTPGQVSYLRAPGKLCDTIDYNVTFERGTKIAYSDRCHIHISGTASIDKDGNVVHEGDIIRQTDRTLENIDALLVEGGAKFDDMMYLLVYLRDPSDADAVRQHLAKKTNGLPLILLGAPVCRPKWLIEMEGVAIIGNTAPELPNF